LHIRDNAVAEEESATHYKENRTHGQSLAATPINEKIS
jgi:hypothetical protein